MTDSLLSRRVVGWFQGSVNRRILGAALTVGTFSIVVKITATLKELAVAYRFGTGDVVDAFLIALLVPQLVVNTVGASLTAAFTPVYISVRESEGTTAARRLFGSTTFASLVILVCLTLVMIIVMPLALRLLASGFSAQKLALARSLFFVLVPIVVLNGALTMWSAVANAEHRFAAAALAPICVPLVTLVAVLVAGGVWGIEALSVGTVLGFVCQCGLLAWVLFRHELPIIPRWFGVTVSLRAVASQYLPMVAGAALMTASWAIGQAMAATLPAGSVASLNYGTKVAGMISEVGSMALATAVLPHFSVMVARREWGAVRKTVRAYARIIAVTAVPVTLMLIVLSPAIVRLLYERGAFTAIDTAHVAAIQGLYLLQVPFVMIGMLFVRLASSLQRNKILLIGAAITLPLNVLLNLLLMGRMGADGIALSTSIVYVVSCCYLAVSAGRALRKAQTRDSV